MNYVQTETNKIINNYHNNQVNNNINIRINFNERNNNRNNNNQPKTYKDIEEFRAEQRKNDLANLKKGQIWYIDLGEKKFKNDNLQHGERPVMIIANEKCCKNSPVVQIVPLTTVDKKWLPTHVAVDMSFGLREPSYILCEQITAINVCELKYKQCEATDEVMKKVDKALLIQIGVKDRTDAEENYINSLVELILNEEETVREFELIRNKELIMKHLNKQGEYIDTLDEYCDKFRIDSDELLNKKREERSIKQQETVKIETSIKDNVVYLNRNYA
jgi:mRNA-degrading endonuclease toxin of MazEF toxin-antitoxin module